MSDEDLCECDRPDEADNPHRHDRDVECVMWANWRGRRPSDPYCPDHGNRPTAYDRCSCDRESRANRAEAAACRHDGGHDMLCVLPESDAWTTAAVWEFARAFARTSGDSPDCQCVSCLAYRAVQVHDSCPGCGGSIQPRYARHGVCRDCYNTTDDPHFPRTDGLYDKYRVERVSDPEGKHAGCRYFVLDPQHDPLARLALVEYAEMARYEDRDALAEDLLAWVRGLDERDGRP